MNIQPLHSYIIVRRIEGPQEVSDGGILLPEIAREDSLVGDVVAVGTGRRGRRGDRKRLEIKPGDRVMFTRRSGSGSGRYFDMRKYGPDLVMIMEEDVVGIVPVKE